MKRREDKRKKPLVVFYSSALLSPKIQKEATKQANIWYASGELRVTLNDRLNSDDGILALENTGERLIVCYESCLVMLH